MKLVAEFSPTPQQNEAISLLTKGLNNDKYQTFKGITGSGKTFVLANLIKDSDRPSIILAPNKVLAYQLYKEFLKFFPNEFVGYYVSNYEIYIPAFYNSALNAKIDGITIVNQENKALRYTVKDFLKTTNNKGIIVCSTTVLFPTFEGDILAELEKHIAFLFRRLREEKNKQVRDFLLEDKREEAATLANQIDHTLDMMLANPGYYNTNVLALLAECLGDDFYLFDYFKDKKPNLFIDESHLSMIQLKALPTSNFKRLKLLVEKGYYINNVVKDNILRFEQLENKVNNITFVSATPSSTELEISKQVVELTSRPNNIPDPKISQRPRDYFLSDRMFEDIKNEQGTVFINCISRKSVILLSKKLEDRNIEHKTLHYKVKNNDRKRILNELREGKIKVILGINMLREGIDVSDCTLVVVEDAAAGTFLRTTSCLIQISGRAARNKAGKVYMCYDEANKSIIDCINEINHRRKIQLNEDYELLVYNKPINLQIKKYDYIKLIDDNEIYQIIKYYSDNNITLNNNQQVTKSQIEKVHDYSA